MATNLFVRDMDLRLPNFIDSRRLEVVADGLPLFGGVQLAVDSTLVFPLHCDGTARRHTANVDVAVLEVARRKKEATCPELVAPRARARLVVWAGEVNGQWSEDQGVPDPAGQSQSTLGNSNDAETYALGRNAGLHSGTNFCRFLPEPPFGRRRRRGGPHHPAGGERGRYAGF